MADAVNAKVTLLQRKATELMAAAPVVISLRVGLMMRARAASTQSDRLEMTLMKQEKTDAMVEAWAAIGSALMSSSQRHLRVGVNAWMNPRTYHELALGSVPKALRFPWNRMNEDLVNAAVKGLEPVHRRAVANAKRLSVLGALPAPRFRSAR